MPLVGVLVEIDQVVIVDASKGFQFRIFLIQYRLGRRFWEIFCKYSIDRADLLVEKIP